MKTPKVSGLVVLHVVPEGTKVTPDEAIKPRAIRADFIERVDPMTAHWVPQARSFVRTRDTGLWVTETLEQVVAAVNALRA